MNDLFKELPNTNTMLSVPILFQRLLALGQLNRSGDSQATAPGDQM